ncbi:MAG: T9SS type A sorting domain-containing protein [Paludibacter sp.]|nr:T9SS type A sorting domain-containing protein [Paludibacter sp.]
MKKGILFMFSILILRIGSAQTTADRMPVEINPTDYEQTSEITIFTEGASPFTNSTVTWTSVPNEFNGFQFFSTESKNAYEGKIVPSATGTIYLVGSGAAVLDGWTKTNYTAVYESTSVTATTVYIFERSVNLGDTIDIPTNNYWAGFSPLAYSITIKGEVSGLNSPINEKTNYLLLTSNSLKISEQIDRPFDLYIYNICGKLVLQKNRINAGEIIPVDFLRNGIYLVKLDTQEKLILQKILKK